MADRVTRIVVNVELLVQMIGIQEKDTRKRIIIGILQISVKNISLFEYDNSSKIFVS